MSLVKRGVTRLVILIGNFVIKIPRLDNGQEMFLLGCLSNWRERSFCKMFSRMPEFYNLVVPTIFCSWFGLFQIQLRCSNKKFSKSVEELEDYMRVYQEGKRLGFDAKRVNLGWYKGRWVWLDYGD